MLAIGVHNLDIVDFKTSVDLQGDRILTDYFTDDEREHCLLSKRSLATYASYFAAKSALFKALPDLARFNLGWRDLEIVQSTDLPSAFSFGGRVIEPLRRLGVGQVHLSFSQSSASTVAFVVVEK